MLNEFKVDRGFHTLLEDVIEASAQFDAIGFEAIMHKGNWPLTRFWYTCEQFKDFNVPLHITEIAVVSGALKTWGGLSAVGAGIQRQRAKPCRRNIWQPCIPSCSAIHLYRL